MPSRVGAVVLPSSAGRKETLSSPAFGGSCARDLRRRGHQVVQADRVIPGGAGLHLAGPAGDERHAVAAFVDAALRFAERRIDAMLRAVVGGGNEQRVLRQAATFQNLHDLAQHRIALEHPVGVTLGVGLPLQPFAGHIHAAALADELRAGATG